MPAQSTAPVLATATVTPRVAVIPADPDSRLRQYLDVFAGLLASPRVSGIVFAENSGADLSPFADAAAAAGRREDVELIGVSSDDWDPEQGRAYGEGLLIRHALESSRLIGADDLFWKITGRYHVRNLDRLIAGAPAATDLYVNLRRHPTPWGDMYLFAANRKGWAAIDRSLSRFAVPGPGEPILYEIVRELMASGDVHVTPRLRSEPFLDAIRGFDGTRHGQGKQLWKYRVRQAGRRVAPWLWI